MTDPTPSAEPRTEAGRWLRSKFGMGPHPMFASVQQFTDAILAIEAEAAQPGLDELTRRVEEGSLPPFHPHSAAAFMAGYLSGERAAQPGLDVERLARALLAVPDEDGRVSYDETGAQDFAVAIEAEYDRLAAEDAP
jgi:hypothetical protein